MSPLNLDSPISTITWRDVCIDSVTEYLEVWCLPEEYSANADDVQAIRDLLMFLTDGTQSFTPFYLKHLLSSLSMSAEMAYEAFCDERDPEYGSTVEDYRNAHDLVEKQLYTYRLQSQVQVEIERIRRALLGRNEPPLVPVWPQLRAVHHDLSDRVDPDLYDVLRTLGFGPEAPQDPHARFVGDPGRTRTSVPQQH